MKILGSENVFNLEEKSITRAIYLNLKPDELKNSSTTCD